MTESTARPKLCKFSAHFESWPGTQFGVAYQAFNTSISIAKLIRKGLKAHIGAHGEPPLGVNYHAEMWYTQSGGLTNYEVSPLYAFYCLRRANSSYVLQDPPGCHVRCC